ncbi:MAG: UDP-N-acetylmuramate--alanine ligase, partial [Porticoccaceae bacterium]
MALESHISQRLFQRRTFATTAGERPADSPPQVHLVGASGAGMTALSEVLLDFGCALTGSDLSVEQEQPGQTKSSVKSGQILKIHQGHDSAHLPTTADLVVFSPAISEDNPERLAAQRLGIPTFSYVELLGELLAQNTGVCIAGTHGKTTTSAMTASILREAGVASSAVIGGEVIQYGRSGWG